jgi:hypothetical protein
MMGEKNPTPSQHIMKNPNYLLILIYDLCVEGEWPRSLRREKGGKLPTDRFGETVSRESPFEMHTQRT